MHVVRFPQASSDSYEPELKFTSVDAGCCVRSVRRCQRISLLTGRNSPMAIAVRACFGPLKRFAEKPIRNCELGSCLTTVSNLFPNFQRKESLVAIDIFTRSTRTGPSYPTLVPQLWSTSNKRYIFVYTFAKYRAQNDTPFPRPLDRRSPFSRRAEAPPAQSLTTRSCAKVV
jgi:hypothetical protein